jgi:hypothetical protein
MLLNRPYPDADEPWDREVIHCEVNVHADAFQGHYPTAVWGHELVFIRAVLAALHERVGQEAEAFIRLIENAFDMQLELTPLGHLTMEVVAHGHPGMGPDLHFSMEADQSYLPLWIEPLDGALAAFPAEVRVDVSDPLRSRGPERIRE